MTTHTPAIDVSHDQPQLPNQHFSPWLRGQTTLFISQISAILGFVLFIASLVYYVSYVSDKSKWLQPPTVKLVVDYAHVVFMAVFILVLIQVLDDNERGSYRVKLVYERVFGKHKGDYEKALKKSEKQLKEFKRRFLWFWIGMMFLYVFFACKHSYELVTSDGGGKSSYSVGLSLTESKSNEGKEERYKADLSYSATDKPKTSPPETGPLNTAREISKKLAFPFVVFFFNNFTLLFVFWCFLVLYIPSDETKERSYKYRNGSILIVGVLTLLFPLFAYIRGGGYTPEQWDEFSAVFDALSGVINAIVLALLIARLDSKLIGLPSWLISILYSYAAVQPLFMVFEISQSDVLQKIAASVLIFVFVSKIYFFLIIIYALQTGKMLNYLFCFPTLRQRAKESELESTSLVNESDATQPSPLSDDTKSTESTEGLVMRLLTRGDKYLYEHLGHGRKRRMLRARGRLSLWLRSDYPLKISAWLGFAAILYFFISLIVSILTQSSPSLFRVGDLKDPAGFAVKLRTAQDPLSLYLREKFSSETGRQLNAYDGSSPPSESFKNALAAGLNQMLWDSGLYDDQRFKHVTLTEETSRLINQNQKPQGEALLRRNRLLLQDAYPKEIAKRSLDIFNVVIDCAQLLAVLTIIVILYLVREENHYGGPRALTTARHIFKESLKYRYPPERGKEQLKRFKTYFLYFWCVTFLLYIVFLLDHLKIGFDAPILGTIAPMFKTLLYPFLEFLLGTLNLLFIFWCFVVLRSPAFNDRDIKRQNLLINYSSFVVALLIAAFPLLLFWMGGPKLSESNWIDYATVFGGVTGTLSAVVLALLIARMDSKLFGLPSWTIGMLFTYASIQPLFVAFALNISILKTVQTSVLTAALGLKICFFLIVAHSLQSGKVLNYLVCFPFLKERVDSIFENQFEIRLPRAEDHSFTVSILKKNQLYYSTEKRFKSREECDVFVHELRDRTKERNAYSHREESGTHWVELRSTDSELLPQSIPIWNLLCESIPLRTKREAHDLIEESIDKIPYCKYNRT